MNATFSARAALNVAFIALHHCVDTVTPLNDAAA